MRVRRSTQPLYIQAAERLREEIRRGAFADAERLPSETELAGLLGVSRPTVREALTVLEGEGFIRRVHGVGTLIRPPEMVLQHGKERLRSFTEVVESLGMVPGTGFRSFRVEAVGEDRARLFGLSPDDDMGVLERVRTADGSPMMYSIDQIPMVYLGSEFSLETFGESLFAYLRQKRKLTFAPSDLAIKAVAASPRLQELLELDGGPVPLLYVSETYVGTDGLPVIHSENFYRSDRYVFRISRDR